MQHLGAYLIKGKLIADGPIEVLEAMDPVTGGAVLLFRPMKGMPPKLEVVGVLPYELPVEDAWIAELPFGVANASLYRGQAELSRLEAWTRRLLAVFAELEAQGLRHGKLRPEDLWIRGDAVWLAGVGVPWPDPEPDAVRLVQVLKALAGDAWEGWRYAEVLEALAEGRIGYPEALAALSETTPAPELLTPPEPEAEPEAAPEPPRPPEPPPTVRVKGTRPPRKEPEPEEKPAPPIEESPPVEEAQEAVRVKGPAKPAKKASEEVEEPLPAAPSEGGEPPEVVQIGEPEDPAFEVVTPTPAEPRGRRGVLKLLLALFLLLLLGFFGYRLLQREQGFVQEVFFEVVPEDARADLVLLSVPEGSRLTPGTRVSIPGKLRFDQEGVYTFEVESEGYRPKTFALEVPVLGGRVTVRLGGR